MPSLLTIREPHPTVPQNSYTHSGRGGAGNFFRAPRTTPPSGVPTPATSTVPPTSKPSSSTRRYYTGRGGAGNARTTAAEERPVLSFDEVYTRAEAHEKTTALSHVGRGGAGNVYDNLAPSWDDGKARRKSSTDDAASGSTSGSTRSSLSGLWARVRSAGH